MIDLLKLAELLHAHERGLERLQLSPEMVDKIQKDTDKMWYGYGRKKLRNDQYYAPLRDPNKNLLGYATFQRVGRPNRNRLILTTILSKHMRPKGDNIGNFFDTTIKGEYPKDPNELEKYKGMDPVPDMKNP